MVSKDKIMPAEPELDEAAMADSMLFPMYKPDVELNLDALLACAFARSQKMMRFIHPKYDANKEFFYAKAQESDHFESRFITGARIVTRMNAIKALGIIMAAKEDTMLDGELFQAVERAWKRMSNLFRDFKGLVIPIALALDTGKVFSSSADNVLHDHAAVFLYFCERYNINPDKDDKMYRHTMAALVDKDVAFLRPFSDILHKAVDAEGSGKDLDDLLHYTMEVLGNAHSVAELGKNLSPQVPEFGMFQILWDFAQLDNVPMSAYEDEEFSRRELQDIIYVLRLHMVRGDFQIEDINKYYIMGLMIRSFSRLYHEAVDVIETYTGIVRESERYKEMGRSIAALTSRIEEQTHLLEQKQSTLNDSQKELDRAKRREMELEEELAEARERAAVLETLLAEDEPTDDGAVHENQAIYSAVQVDAARQARAVVFGGPPNWQAEVKKAAPGFTCIPVTQKGFDTKIIDKADVVVFKTDYMSHAQWYRVVKRAKSRGRKIIYCRNNIDMLLEKVAELIIN